MIAAFTDRRAALGAFALLLIAGSDSAFARCDKYAFNQKYDPAKSVGTSFVYLTDNGSCTITHGIPSRSGAYRYTKTRVLEQASQGKVQYLTLTKWRYVAKTGFSGKDYFKLEVCAESTVASGCSIINYEMRVRL